MSKNNLIIKTQRLVLRPIEEEDLPHLLTWWNNGQIMSSVGFPNGLNLTMEEMKGYWAEWEQDDSGFRKIVCLADGTKIGETNFHDYKPERKEIQIGLKICRPDLWGKGLGTEALQAMTDYAFLNLGVKRVLVNPARTNKAVIRVNEKCGYRIIASNEVALLMELTRAAWEKLRST
jgi:RimJ/RimL family protein N-acetyltransferase